jgi:Nod factor-specific ABC transporter NodJ protein
VLTAVIATRVSPGRVGSVLERNTKTMRGTPLFWMLLLSGVAEPLLYLLSMGLGVGRLVHTTIPYGSHHLSYLRFVAPAMLAASTTAGAISAATFGFFAKLRYSRIFEVIFTTPVSSFEIALAELAWAVIRGAMFSAMFLAVMAALGTTSAAGALAALPATVLVGLAFGAVGMAISTKIRGWQDFDLVTSVQTALFLFSGTFVPVGRYPGWFRDIVYATPLYHAVELIRGLTVGDYRAGLLIQVAYLAAMAAAGLWFSYRQMEKTFRQ